jgi:hypothetical protein
MSVALAPSVFAERASLNYGRQIGTLPMRPIKNESVRMHRSNLDKVTGDFQTDLLMAGALSPEGHGHGDHAIEKKARQTAEQVNLLATRGKSRG